MSGPGNRYGPQSSAHDGSGNTAHPISINGNNHAQRRASSGSAYNGNGHGGNAPAAHRASFGEASFDGIGGLGPGVGSGFGASGTVPAAAPTGGIGGGLGLGGLGIADLSAADSSAILELSRLSPEDMAAVLAAAGVAPATQGASDIEALLGLDLSAFNDVQMASRTANESMAANDSPMSADPGSTSATGADRTPASATSGTSGTGSGGTGTNARPDLVRLADLVTHASLVLQQPQATGGPRKYTRSRRGCLTCRARKVKCDEVRPKCLRCAAMGRECTWDDEKSEKGKKSRKKSTSQGSAAATAATAAGASGASTSPTTRMTSIPEPASNAAAAPLPARKRSTAAEPPGSASTSLPNLPFFGGLDGVPALPGVPQHSNADALAAAGLVPGLASALAQLAQNAGPSASPFDASGSASQWGESPPRRQSDPTPSHYTTGFQPFKPTPPTSGGLDERTSKRSRPNEAAAPSQSELAGLPFDFQSWVHNVNLESPTSNKGSEGSEIIELTRAAPDERGRIQLESADGTTMFVDEGDYAQTGADIRLSLKGHIARRRHGEEPHQTTSATSPPFATSLPMDFSGDKAPVDPAAAADSTHADSQRPPLPRGMSLIRLASLPTRDLDPFKALFPTASTRNLFQHYVRNTSQIVTAMGRSKPRDNPFLQVSLPLILGESGSPCPANAALRFSLLTTSAAHLLHLTGGQDTADLGDRLKKLAIGYTVISQSETDKDRRTNGALVSAKSERDNDLVLAACVVLITRDVLSADTSWKANLDFAMASIRARGGPEALMAREPTNFVRRFVLEQLATHETFGCFTTGGEPTLLTPEWWFDIERSSKSYWEWESIENTFGVSRKMIEMVARINGLCARKNRLGPTASLDDPELTAVAEYLRGEAEALIVELDTLAVSLRSLPLQRRVQFGDHIYRLTMSVHLMTEILRLPASHPRIRAIVPAALELCSEISNEPVMLVWPVLILARVAEPSEREWISSLMSSYRDQYCRDLEAAQKLIQAAWQRQDEGRAFESWHSLMTDMGMEVLLI